MTRRANIIVALVVGTASIAGAAAGQPKSAEIDSKRSDFLWRLPPGWEFTEPDRSGQGLPTVDAAEVVVARTKGQPGPQAMLIVTESVSSDPGADRKASNDSEQYGRMKLSLASASNVRAEAVSISGMPTTRVSGVVPRRGAPFRSVAVLKIGRRRFEIVCSGQTPPASKPDDPCDPVLAGLTVRRREDAEVETPRPLRLRGEVLGIHYDPPDDAWLGIGPRLGVGGAQKVWAWMLGGRQIDVQGMDVSVFAAYPSAKGLANVYGTKARSEGATVRVGTETDRGVSWVHLEISRKTGGQQEDMFIRRTEGTLYTVHVAQTTRDRSLVRRALAGFSLAKTDTPSDE